MLSVDIEYRLTNGLGFNPGFNHEDTSIGLVRHLGEMGQRQYQTALFLFSNRYRNLENQFDQAMHLANVGVNHAKMVMKMSEEGPIIVGEGNIERFKETLTETIEQSISDAVSAVFSP